MTDALSHNIVVAYPEQVDCAIRHQPLREFSDYCRSVKICCEFADRAAFDAFKLRPWLGFIMILEYLPEEDDFRYRIYGTHIAEQSGFDMTGRRVSAFGGPVGQFFERLYRDSMATKRLIYSEHTRLHARYDCDWHRVICPVKAGDGVQIVACNYPVQRMKTPGGNI